MNKSVRAIAKLNLKNLHAAYIATAACIAALASNFIISAAALRDMDLSMNVGLSIGWALLLLPVLAGILVPARNFRRIINLGGKRGNFFRGCLLTYALLACTVSLLGVIVYYVIDRPYIAYGRLGGLITVPELFGWSVNGFIAVFVQQFAFMFLSSVFAHTLAAAQGRWFGFVADGALVAIISVFTPIAPLRTALAQFFHLILFARPPLQITACLFLAMVIYTLNKPILAKKVI
jgi:hypothetical protein